MSWRGGGDKSSICRKDSHSAPSPGIQARCKEPRAWRGPSGFQQPRRIMENFLSSCVDSHRRLLALCPPPASHGDGPVLQVPLHQGPSASSEGDQREAGSVCGALVTNATGLLPACLLDGSDGLRLPALALPTIALLTPACQSLSASPYAECAL